MDEHPVSLARGELRSNRNSGIAVGAIAVRPGQPSRAVAWPSGLLFQSLIEDIATDIAATVPHQGGACAAMTKA
jgi:hypothetical protein